MGICSAIPDVSGAGQIIVLKDGQVHATGKLAELLAYNEELQCLWGQGETTDGRRLAGCLPGPYQRTDPLQTLADVLVR